MGSHGSTGGSKFKMTARGQIYSRPRAVRDLCRAFAEIEHELYARFTSGQSFKLPQRVSTAYRPFDPRPGNGVPLSMRDTGRRFTLRRGRACALHLRRSFCQKSALETSAGRGTLPMPTQAPAPAGRPPIALVGGYSPSARPERADTRPEPDQRTRWRLRRRPSTSVSRSRLSSGPSSRPKHYPVIGAIRLSR